MPACKVLAPDVIDLNGADDGQETDEVGPDEQDDDDGCQRHQAKDDALFPVHVNPFVKINTRVQPQRMNPGWVGLKPVRA